MVLRTLVFTPSIILKALREFRLSRIISAKSHNISALTISHLNRSIITDPARPFKNFATEPYEMPCACCGGRDGCEKYARPSVTGVKVTRF